MGQLTHRIVSQIRERVIYVWIKRNDKDQNIILYINTNLCFKLRDLGFFEASINLPIDSRYF